MRKKLLIEILVLSAIVLVFHKFALTYALYWTTAWFDLMMHILGGFLIALIATYFFFISPLVGKFPTRKGFAVFYAILSMVIIVGLSWEVFELMAGLTNPIEDRFDTILDLIMDIIGGVTAYLYVKGRI